MGLLGVLWYQSMVIAVASVGFSVASRPSDVSHLYLEKSFPQALHDCMQYLQVPPSRYEEYQALNFPNDPQTRCLVRCVGLNLRWWNDTTGVHTSVIANFFRPDPTDVHYERATKECVEHRLKPTPANPTLQDCCLRAYNTFECYLQNYGNLVYSPQYYPEDRSRQVQVSYDCINILQVSKPLLQLFTEDSVPEDPGTQCLGRCFFLRLGLYDEERGFDLRRLYTRDYVTPNKRYLSKETYDKLCAIRLTSPDQCTEVNRAYFGVIKELETSFHSLSIAHEAARKALSDGSTCAALEP
ncbi:general odorant-binding protein 45-like [Anopheles cruzii]|uniref:general odorant-binding protein 45-like n=1 Tax=Anopheles cruzii TaxID=68878 RepID=UPI0022EC4ABD|nr:general odorant-binding protein 45-like [Anopheles cruzii]XP_052870988.1 general odorant-binding protein 45-like [Anopheles cruzii]